MSTEIYYFSGTGNSLYIAKQLKEKMEDVKLIPIINCLKKEKIEIEAENIGFVFPLYLSNVPKPVQKFLEKLDIKSTKYTFAVITRIGTFSFAHVRVDTMLKMIGYELNAYFYINMANNSPTGLTPGKGDYNWIDKTNKKLSAIEENVQNSLTEIIPIINSKSKYPVTKFKFPFIDKFEKLFYNWISGMKTEIGLCVDKTCTGCGVCEEVCPSYKIKIEDNRPKWKQGVDCYYCFACFNFCPEQAIIIKDKYDKKDGRYQHPNVNTLEIINQKSDKGID